MRILNNYSKLSIKKEICSYIFIILVIKFGFTHSGFSQTVKFFIPDTQGTTGQEIMIPIHADHFAREDSFGSMDLSIKFNSNYLRWRGISTNGTLINGWSTSANFDSTISEARISSASPYVSRIKPDAILTKLVFFVLAEFAGSFTNIEITRLDLKRNDLYLENDSVKVKVNAIPVTYTNGRFVTIESNSKTYDIEKLGYFSFSDGSIVHLVFNDGSNRGKIITVNNLGQATPPGAFLSNKAVSVIQIQSDLSPGSFSSEIRVIYTDAQLRSAGVKNESTLVLSRCNTQTGIWEPYPTMVDVNSNFISATVDRFSYWAITETSSGFRIPLSSGWNLISSNVSPQFSRMDSVFQSIVSNVVIVKNFAGKVYWPRFGVNQIVNWTVTEGYWVYMNSAGTLTVSGNPMNPTTPINLLSGWNIIAYFPTSTLSPAIALASLGSKVVVLKDGVGKVYWPRFNIDQIGTLQAGKGYLIYLNSTGTLIYPAME